jgi:hypothetical protein
VEDKQGPNRRGDDKKENGKIKIRMINAVRGPGLREGSIDMI